MADTQAQAAAIALRKRSEAKITDAIATIGITLNLIDPEQSATFLRNLIVANAAFLYEAAGSERVWNALELARTAIEQANAEHGAQVAHA